MSNSDETKIEPIRTLSTPASPETPSAVDAPPENHREEIQSQTCQEVLPAHSESRINRQGCKEKPYKRNTTTEGKNRIGRSPDGYKRRSKVEPAQIGFKRTHQIVELALKGTPQEVIAEAYGITTGTVNVITSKFRNLITELQNVQDFKLMRRNILDAAHCRLLESVIDPEAIADANLRDRAWAAESIYKQSRLESNLSTDNKGVHKFMTVSKRDLV